MTTEPGLAIRRKSASPSSGTNVRRETAEVSKLVDIDLCIGCKACEVACKEWNNLEAEDTSNFGSYQSHEDLTASTWDLMRFKEVDLDNGDLAWLIRKDSCMHCEEPGCLLACPAPGAVVQYENGIVDFDQTKCIGCQYCVAGCPFDIPRFDQHTKKVYKCTMCVDRVAGGLEPACVKACPTGSIRFGSREEMLAYGSAKVGKLHDRGFDDALLYDPSGVGGLRTLRGVGAVALWAGVIGAAIYWLRTGRRRPPPEAEVVAAAERLGEQREEERREAEVPAVVGARTEGDEAGARTEGEAPAETSASTEGDETGTRTEGDGAENGTRTEGDDPGRETGREVEP
jgi:formate dehydrogenase iron-sulfur subunit